jgi:transposase
MNFTVQINAFQASDSLSKCELEALTRLFENAQKEAEKHLSSTQAELLRAQTESHHFKIHIEKLTLELAYLRRQRFGAKSENYSIEQADLFQENFSTDIAAIETELAKKMAAKQAEADAQPTLPRARAGGRQPLPEHLPRVDFIHAPTSCDCGQCGKALIKIGADVTEELTVQPAAFSVERHIYPKYACRTCETVTAMPVAPAIIDGGYASVDLLVWIIVGKFVDHLPLYRLAM